jgi:hypothetical protein
LSEPPRRPAPRIHGDDACSAGPGSTSQTPREIRCACLVQEKNTHLEGAVFINSRGQIIGQGLLHNEWRDYILTPRN